MRASNPRVEGTFDREFKVNGPVTLELTVGSDDAHITAGSAGEVRIHGEIHVTSWGAESDQRRAAGARIEPSYLAGRQLDPHWRS